MARKSTTTTASTLPLANTYINFAVVTTVDPDEGYKATICCPKSGILPDPEKNSGQFEWQANILQALNLAAADMLQENESERTVISLRKLLAMMPEEYDIGISLRDKAYTPSVSTSHKENPVLQMYKNEKQKQDEEKKQKEEAYQRYLNEQQDKSLDKSEDVPF